MSAGSVPFSSVSLASTDLSKVTNRPDNPRPLVSVIVPAYNAAATIAQTLRTVQDQTLADWEVVACDDGSTDRTPAILLELSRSEPRLRVVTQPNAGAGRARNAAIAAARGRLIKFLDADDRLEPACLQTLAPLAQAHGAACGSWSIDDALGEPVGISVSPGSGPVGLDRLLEDNPVAPSAAMVSREVMSLEDFSEAPAAADYDLWLRLAARGIEWQTTPETVARYRLLASSNSKKCGPALAHVAACLRTAFEAARGDPRIDASEVRLRTALRAHALRYASLHALIKPTPGQDDACDMVESLGLPLRSMLSATGGLIGDASFEAVLAATATRPTLTAAAHWNEPLAAWWRAIEQERWAEAGFADRAIERFASRSVDPRAIAHRLLDSAGADAVLVGHGTNGRLIEQLASRRGVRLTIRDDRYQPNTDMPTNAEPMDEPIKGRCVIVSPIADAGLARRFPGALRWPAVASELASVAEASLRGLLLRSRAA